MDHLELGEGEHGMAAKERGKRMEPLAFGTPAEPITHARAGDMIVLLGKGHEDYVEIRGVKHHFSEKEAIWEIVGDIKADRYHMEDDGIRFF